MTDNILYIFIAAIIQGLTEFLPISSSGHLIIVKEFFNINIKNIDLEIMLHLGTVFSIIFYYKKDIISIIKNIVSNNHEDKKFISLILIGCIPISIVGLLFKNTIETQFTSINFLPFTFFLTSLFLYKTKKIKYNNLVTFRIAIIIGIVQIITLLPGISRSGITIATLLMLGVNHKDSIKFSFLMAIPLILGATFLGIEFSNYSFQDIKFMILGSIISFIFGFVAISLTNNLVENKRYWLFSIYCLVISFSLFFLKKEIILQQIIVIIRNKFNV